MGCGGSKQGGKGRRGESRVEDGYDRRPKVSVRIGPQVKKLDSLPGIIFIFGGPGSRKGCIVDDLVTAYGLKHICTEEILYHELPKKLANIAKIENVNGMKEILESDPSHVTLEWLFEMIQQRIDSDPNAHYLIDFIPNLKYMLRSKFLQENITEALEAFEEKYPISFALNLAIPADRVIGAKQVFCASPNDAAALKESGGKGDEADAAKLQRRAALYEQSSRKLIDYFARSERLITVDVTCGVAELIWHQVHRVLCELDFLPRRTVNTVLLFVFDDSDLKEFDYDRYLMEEVNLEGIVENPESSLENLLMALTKHVDSHSQKTDAFVVKTKGTVISKHASRKSSHRMIVFTDISEGYLETFLPGSPKNFQPRSDSCKYKAVSSLENELCLFPLDTSDEVCVAIALHMAQNRSL